MPTKLVLPTAIPWNRLKRKDLEECLYWLLDAMGAKDLEWRVGGKGDGATDQGRDLEAHFYTPDPDGSLVRRKWWIEAKGRTGTVAPSIVKASVLNAAGKSDVDYLVIATNTTFSNPTRDWVAEWSKTNPRPVVRLWPRHELERLLSSHPDVVVRFFSEALSRQGQLEVVRSRFWNYATYADRPILRTLWSDREALEWEHQALLAVVVSEATNGSLTNRPWASWIGDSSLLEVLGLGVANLGYFCFRADSAGTEQSPYFRGLAYLLLGALARHPAATVERFLREIWDHTEGDRIPKGQRGVLLQEFLKPVLVELHAQLRDVCTSDCHRVSMDRVELSREEVEQYWLRLASPSRAKDEDSEDHRFLVFERSGRDCKVGFKMSSHSGCPLVSFDREKFTIDHLGQTLQMFGGIVRARAGLPPETQATSS
jgi:hypothetical protein